MSRGLPYSAARARAGAGAGVHVRQQRTRGRRCSRPQPSASRWCSCRSSLSPARQPGRDPEAAPASRRRGDAARTAAQGNAQAQAGGEAAREARTRAGATEAPEPETEAPPAETAGRARRAAGRAVSAGPSVAGTDVDFPFAWYLARVEGTDRPQLESAAAGLRQAARSCPARCISSSPATAPCPGHPDPQQRRRRLRPGGPARGADDALPPLPPQYTRIVAGRDLHLQPGAGTLMT